ncbi:zinc finger domain-containing protein [Halosimplex pelagicum]|uniref:DNA-binding phage zinc finger domain-containing protein n=1 Tax=Halosimplex pelagicum TaxID=869886 RepID=A0A7D5TCW3_9EURY|nr:hypothetical protein [Halosimplex pelagicum]QLH82435.1 hypothetical protein HZS54_12775 [Halosimplex pelagicum]QLH82491.1 hypothetical protein HZS54_13080 [Halosimplex pelagicum]
MTVHRATCGDCHDTYTDPDLGKVAEWAEDHEQKEMHDVDIERAVATDGGEDLPKPIKWSYHAVVHGAAVDADCLALTGAGKPCSNNAYLSNDDPVCNIHASTSDPEIVDDAHQWARITDDDATITVCVNCELVVDGREPAVGVACPECDAGVGDRCRDEENMYSANIPPHPQRRRRAYETLRWFTPCEDNPAGATPVATDGGHSPTAAGAGAQGPQDGAFATDEAPHKCDICLRVFDELADLDDHDCRPLAELVDADGGESDV